MYKRLKRVLDVLAALAALVLLSPLLLVTAVFVRLSSKGPVIFKQERIGKDGKVGKGDPRVTKVGRFLRATSIDELPQLVNILKGEMSFIGPRPPLTYHPWPYSAYTPEQRRMFAVRPGMTGWAQVNGRKGVEWNHRIKLNVWYVEHMSLRLDIKILFLTVLKVFSNADNENTAATVQPAEAAAETSAEPTESVTK